MTLFEKKGEHLNLKDFKENTDVQNVLNFLKNGCDNIYAGVFIYYIYPYVNGEYTHKLETENYLMQAHGIFDANGKYAYGFDVDKCMERVEALFDKIMKTPEANIIGFNIIVDR